MADTKQAKLKDLEFDNKNFNKHTEFGMSLLEKSLRNNGAGRSILIDKNNRIIGGNGVVEVAGQIGLENVRIVESDGTEIIAVKRTDIDLDSKQGREMALADNATASADLAWDYEALADIESEFDVDAGDWGVILDDTDYGVLMTGDTSPKNGKFLKFGEYKIPVNEDEEVFFTSLIEQHKEKSKTLFGFITFLQHELHRD